MKEPASVETKYIIDVLVKCSERSTLNSLIPPETGKIAKMQVTQIFMNCIEELSSIRIFMPKDLRPVANRTTVENSINEVLRRYGSKVPCLDPFNDLKVGIREENDDQIQDDSFAKLMKNYERLVQRIDTINFDLNDPHNQEVYKAYEEKMALSEQLKGMKKDIENAKTLVLTVRVMNECHCRIH